MLQHPITTDQVQARAIGGSMGNLTPLTRRARPVSFPAPLRQSRDLLIQSARPIGKGKMIVELFCSLASTFNVER